MDGFIRDAAGVVTTFVRNGDGAYSSMAVPGAASWLLHELNNNGIAVGAAQTIRCPRSRR